MGTADMFLLPGNSNPGSSGRTYILYRTKVTWGQVGTTGCACAVLQVSSTVTQPCKVSKIIVYGTHGERVRRTWVGEPD